MLFPRGARGEGREGWRGECKGRRGRDEERNIRGEGGGQVKGNVREGGEGKGRGGKGGRLGRAGSVYVMLV